MFQRTEAGPENFCSNVDVGLIISLAKAVDEIDSKSH